MVCRLGFLHRPMALYRYSRATAAYTVQIGITTWLSPSQRGVSPARLSLAKQSRRKHMDSVLRLPGGIVDRSDLLSKNLMLQRLREVVFAVSWSSYRRSSCQKPLTVRFTAQAKSAKAGRRIV
ncbi:unnamed protein product [Polarella glacialis]|uniref:Uncharacterized protein n=1 Tax=Polarella glacialis TaxID=89957 RepID=A0A813LJ43_POLGL|nr:unnamed protein product [Polarella glacialis]